MAKNTTKKVGDWLVHKWLESTGYYKALEGFEWEGKPMVLNKKTGEWSNEIPPSLITSKKKGV